MQTTTPLPDESDCRALYIGRVIGLLAKEDVVFLKAFCDTLQQELDPQAVAPKLRVVPAGGAKNVMGPEKVRV